MSVTVLSIPHGKVVYKRKQGFDYGGGGEVNHFKPLQLEYKGYINPGAQQKSSYPQYHQQFPQKSSDVNQNFQQEFNHFYKPQTNYNDDKIKQAEQLALFVSKPEEQHFFKQQQPVFENTISKTPQNAKSLDWESFKLENHDGHFNQEFQPVLQKPPQTSIQQQQPFNGYNYQEPIGDNQPKNPIYPPLNDFYPSRLKQPQQPVNFYVGFDNFKQNAIQQPAEAAKQNFNAINVPHLQQQPTYFSSQQQKDEGLLATTLANHGVYGGHFLESDKSQQNNLPLNHQQQQQISHEGFKQFLNDIDNYASNQQGSGGFKNSFGQISNNDVVGNHGITNEFKKPNEQSILKFSNEDAVEPQEVGKVNFGNGVNFGVGVEVNESKREKEKKKKKRTKRLRTAREPKYTYIIRARRHRD